MNVYVAASLSSFRDAQQLASDLTARGFNVVSTWHGLVTADSHDSKVSELERRNIAVREMSEVYGADVVSALLDVGNPRGAYVEVGLALGFGLPIVWRQKDGVGRTIFDGLSDVHRVQTSEEVIRALELLRDTTISKRLVESEPPG